MPADHFSVRSQVEYRAVDWRKLEMSDGPQGCVAPNTPAAFGPACVQSNPLLVPAADQAPDQITRCTVAGGSGGLPGLRVLSRVRPATPSCIKRFCRWCSRSMKKPNPGARPHPAVTADEAGPRRHHDPQLERPWYHHAVRRNLESSIELSALQVQARDRRPTRQGALARLTPMRPRMLPHDAARWSWTG
jgi:hypothetical protein